MLLKSIFSQQILGLMARKNSLLKLNSFETSKQVSPSWAPYTESQVGGDFTSPTTRTFHYKQLITTYN